jgi:hypothetical protein
LPNPYNNLTAPAAVRFISVAGCAEVSFLRADGCPCSPKKEEAMTNQDDEDKSNMRIMWIASGVIVLGLVVLTLTLGTSNQPTSSTTDAIGGQSQTTPAK